MPASNKKKPSKTQPPATTSSAALSPSAAISPPAPVSTETATPSAPPPVSEESLAKLIALATSSPDSPLGLVWKHAFKEGSAEGFKRGVEFYKGLDVKEAYREGATQGQIIGILAEREEWETMGHGSWCFETAPCIFCEIGPGPSTPSQPATVKVDAMVQVEILKDMSPPLQAEVSIQADPPQLLLSSSSQTDSPSTHSIAVQAIFPTTTPASENAPTTTIPTISPTPAFDWAEDAATIPIVASQPATPPPRDFSILRSTNPNPFGSLKHRGRRSHFFQQHDSHCSPSYQPRQYTTQSLHRPTSLRPRLHLAPHTRPLHPPTLSVTLDWESDPRLLDLGRALKALGWVRS